MYSRPVIFPSRLVYYYGYIILTSISGKLLTNKEIFILGLVNTNDTASLVVYNEGMENCMKGWLKSPHHNNDHNNITVPINHTTADNTVISHN